MNPLDMRGPEFLAFYVAIFAVAMVIAIAIRRTISRSGPQPLKPPELELFELAYLAGGTVRTIQAALVALASGRAILAGKRGTFTAIEGAPRASDPIVASVQRTIIAKPNCRFSHLVSGCRSELNALEDRLCGSGLMLRHAVRAVVGLLTFGLLFAIVWLGVAKINVGVERHKPVGFLTFLCVIGFVVSIAMGTHPPRLTTAGKQTLEEGKKRHAISRVPATQGLPDMALLMGVALFGPPLLAGTALADFQQPLTYGASSSGFNDTSSSGSSCGGSGCGGGGGCGGCGGD